MTGEKQNTQTRQTVLMINDEDRIVWYCDRSAID